MKVVQSFQTLLTDHLFNEHAGECKLASVLCAHLWTSAFTGYQTEV